MSQDDVPPELAEALKAVRSSPRTDLRVPFHEKDHASALGARWDPKQRTWFVPAGVDPAAFSRWLPGMPAREPEFIERDPDLKLTHPGLAHASWHCYSCAKPISVVEVFGFDPDGVALHIGEVEGMDEALKAQLVCHPTFKPGYSASHGGWYYANHCGSCGRLQGSHYLSSEPDGPFFALHRPKAEVTLESLAGPVWVAAPGNPSGEVSW